MTTREVLLQGHFAIGQTRPITLFAGLNVLETPELTLDVATTLKGLSERYGLNLIFKASWDKANRTFNYRGPGMEVGLECSV